MRIYVASKFENFPEVREVYQILRDAGHEITHDWTQEHCDPTWPPEQQHRYLQACGAADFRGVVKADALVMINHPLCRDTMAEMGIALGMHKPVFVLHPERRMSVFFHRAVWLGSDREQLLSALSQYAERSRYMP